MIYLDAINYPDLDQIVDWRNKDISGARTPYMLTYENEYEWFEKDVCNRESRNRWFAVRLPGQNKYFIGLSGLTNIEWENGKAEIALLIDPQRRGKGYGKEALQETLRVGFGDMRLHMIYGEVYACNPHRGFWEYMIKQYSAYSVFWPNAKRWNGKSEPSTLFQITEGDFKKVHDN